LQTNEKNDEGIIKLETFKLVERERLLKFMREKYLKECIPLHYFNL